MTIKRSTLLSDTIDTAAALLPAIMGGERLVSDI